MENSSFEFMFLKDNVGHSLLFIMPSSMTPKCCLAQGMFSTSTRTM